MKKKLRVYIRDDQYVFAIKSYASAYVNEAVEQAALILENHAKTLGVARHKTQYDKLAAQIRDIKKWEYQ